MKMFFIIYSQAADDDVMVALKQAGIRAYTKMQEVRGEGTETEPKLGTHFWPGTNNVLLIAVSEHEAPIVTDFIKKCKKEHPKSGIKGFVLPMEEQVP